MEMRIPEAGAGHVLGRQAGGDHGLGFNRLLIEARPDAAAREKSIAADGHEMTLGGLLKLAQPLQRL